MLVKDILKSVKTSFSFEFFPPRTEKGFDNLFESIRELKKLDPSYVSVTYGAGGTTRDRTHKLVERIKSETDTTVVSHLTCVGSSRDEIYEILERYKEIGVENILALRGDAEEGDNDWQSHSNGFTHAHELVEFIKKNFPHMCVGVAGFPEGHPDTPNRILEMEHLKAKVDCGADYIVTQLFFDNRDFYDFRERCVLNGVDVPVIAGIMPVQSEKGLYRMADLAAGARIPASLLKSVKRAKTDECVGNVGIHWATEQVRDLLDKGVDGIHFYTLNKSPVALKIYESLGISNSGAVNG